MCGISGFLGFEGAAESIVHNMVGAIIHRGPDAQKTWLSPKNNIAFGHARLAVIDITETGAQPMHSHSGRYIICYNGEIYNHLDIRQELEDAGQAPAAWRGTSDSETFVASLDARGIEPTLNACVGMFAIAIWDSADKRLILARDRFGEKPLYYQPESDGVIFASEVSAIEQHPRCMKQISDDAVFELANRQCIPAPLSIYNGVFKLLPGSLIVFNSDGFVSTHQWWSAIDSATSNQHKWQGDTQDAVDELEVLLEKCVKRQMQADVSLGAFLSGGIDSSLVVALMQKNHMQPVNTFSIGFEADTFDEAKYAAKVAKHLGTSHTEHYVSEQDVCDLVPTLSTLYSEPFADSSQLPTYLVSSMTRQAVTVALTGDAGDEVFGGYNRHVFVQQHWPMVSKVPVGLRKMAFGLIDAVDESRLDKWFGKTRATANWTRVGERLKRTGHSVTANSLDELYRFSTRINDVSHVAQHIATSRTDSSDLGPQATLMHAQDEQLLAAQSTLDGIRWMMVKDQVDYMPNDILVKVDRASMACSLETRAPFLDHELVEFSQQLPSGLLNLNKRSKYPLRAILENHIPSELFERPKMGFSVPIHNMLKNQLRDWAEFHLSERQINDTSVFESAKVQKLWSDHCRGLRNNIAELWPILVYQAWAHDRAN